MPKLVDSSPTSPAKRGEQLIVHRILKTVNREPITVNWRPWRQGFTLIELLVVLGILTAAVGASLIFLTSVLKGTNQANVTAEVKQNGQVVLDSLEKQIRGATSAVVITGSGLPGGATKDGVNLALPTGRSLYLVCFDTDPIAKSNGWIGVADVSPGTPTNAFSNYNSVTNKDNISGVDVKNCDFSVQQASTTGTAAPAVVSISFVMNQGIQAPSRADFLANAKFETTISLRNY